MFSVLSVQRWRGRYFLEEGRLYSQYIIGEEPPPNYSCPVYPRLESAFIPGPVRHGKGDPPFLPSR